MKAAVVTKNHTVDIQDKVLRPLKHGEAALKMECCGVCHTDLHVKNGDFGEVPGITLGHEGIGVVSAVGEGVTSLKVGDRASVAWFYQWLRPLRILRQRQRNPVPFGEKRRLQR